MNLQQHQRMKFLKYVKPFFIKDKCEICGTDEELEIHHNYQFSKLLDKTLKELNLEYKEDTEEYTKEQIKLITDIMIGKQMRTKYTTVCRSCHVMIHNVYGKERPFLKGSIIDVELIEKELREKYLGIKLFKNEQKELEEFMRNSGYNRRSFGKKNTNTFLESLNIPFKIISKRVKIKGKLYTIWRLVEKENLNQTIENTIF